MRIAVTGEVWDVLNQAWGEMRMMTPEGVRGSRLVTFLEWVKTRSFLFRGAVDGTLLRNEGFHFIELGKNIERADATARLLDVKYNVLLPNADEVGRALDVMQWHQILRAANAERAFRAVYHHSVTPEGVVDFLVLNPQSPRSLLRCYVESVDAIASISTVLPDQSRLLIRAQMMRDDLRELSVESILSAGLHEWLTDTIVETNRLAMSTAAAYGFDRPLEAADV
jgi:uncharacterized alpha-E superfamily protein